MTQDLRIAVDIGGTFTDIEIFDAVSGDIHQLKTPSTPGDPSVGLVAGIREACDRFGLRADAVGHLLHGTTIATNAVLERKLPVGALITTAGFEDVFQIGRHGRNEVYAITLEPPPPLVARSRCFGVSERVDARGRVTTPLDETAVGEIAERLAAGGVQAVAVCLLHAYANPIHERRIGEMLARLLPGVAVTLSSEISPEIREYERMSTAVLNVLLMPIVQRYTDRLASRIGEELPGARVYLVQSNGGVAGLAKAGREPARLLLSGPSGGAAAARRLARELGERNLVAVDMGGTSFDVSIVHEGEVSMVNEGAIDGLPVRLPMVEMRTIGAGGGSVAWVDQGGRLRIGPKSAGADPGPACYGRGGDRFTVTDANLLLGRLDATAFMGGRMPLDAAAARRAAAPLAAELGLGVDALAAGVVAVTNSALATATRLSLFEKGMDPEDFALLSFGGAGGVHACEVADELGIRRTIFPAHASTLSAWGILWSDIAHDLGAMVIGRLSERGAQLQESADRLRREAAALLDEDGVPAEARALEWSVDLRYEGQAFDLTVPWPSSDFSQAGIDAATAAFHALHRQRFSYDEPSVPVEVVALRVRAVGRLSRPATPRSPETGTGAPASRQRAVIGLDGPQDCPVWDRAAILPGRSVSGPAIVEEPYTSIYVPPGWAIEGHPSGVLVATRHAIP